MLLRLCLGVLLTAAAACVASAGERTWTDVQGRTMRAELVRELDGEVTMLRAGKLITIRLSTLSEADRQFIRDVAAGKPVSEDPAANSAKDSATSPFSESTETPADAAAQDAETEGKAAAARARLGKKAPPAVNRAWADNLGNTTTAKFVRMFGRNVVLMRGVRTVTIGYDKLSAADQEHLKEFLTERGLEEQIPPPLPMDNDDGGAVSPSAPSPPSAPSIPSSIEEMMQRNRDQANQRAEEARQRSEEAQSQIAERQAQEQQRREEQAAEAARVAAERQAAYEASQEAARARMQEYRDRQAEEQRARQEEFAANQPAGRCSKCFRSISKTEAEGTHCPHCNTRWTFRQNEFGQKEVIAGAGTELVTRGIFFIVIILVICLGALAAFIAIVVAIIRSIMNAGNNSRRRQYY